jgi:hypothetical protein
MFHIGCAGKDGGQGVGALVFGEFGKKSQVAEVDADHRNRESGGGLGNSQQGAVPAEDDEYIQIGFDCIGQTLNSSLGQPGHQGGGMGGGIGITGFADNSCFFHRETLR